MGSSQVWLVFGGGEDGVKTRVTPERFRGEIYFTYLLYS